MRRRTFLEVTGLGGAAAVAALPAGTSLPAPAIVGGLQRESGAAPIAGAIWYTAAARGDGLEWSFPAGTLQNAAWLSCDMLLDGRDLAAWTLQLYEQGAQPRRFRLSFGALAQCGLRVRVPLAAVDQSRWMIDREGAYLKPRVSGDRVDLAKVIRMTLTVSGKGPQPVRWCMTSLAAVAAEVPRLETPVLPKGKLLDELGQSALHDWPGKTRSAAELKRRVTGQLDAAPGQKWPGDFSRWGGWKAKKLGEGTGFFRVQKEAGRWWIADPDGYAFWSNGPDCVRIDCEGRFDGLESALTWLPEPTGEWADIYAARLGGAAGRKHINYLAANIIRSVGHSDWRDKWAQIAIAELKRLRFNTVGNWSEWEFAQKAKFPYVRPLSFRASRSGWIYRDFPDVFHPQFDADAAAYAAQLGTSANDPAFLGYFLMNEPLWAFSSELPAMGMLYNTPQCATRGELAKWLRTKYEGDAALAAAWKLPGASFDRVAQGRWPGVFPPEALADLRDFSTRLVDVYFSTISKACRRADPKHLNLGMRWQGIPPEWAVTGMRHFDVYSLNSYRPKFPRETSDKINALLNMPTLVGEWHFGALDVGLPSGGLVHVANQTDRGRAYRVYLEDAAAQPNCVGAHWFTLYDQAAIGRFDGENYNIGFLDICNRPYEEISKAAIASHERLYKVAAGEIEPFSDAPQYLPTAAL
jgi:hypothetical protein